MLRMLLIRDLFFRTALFKLFICILLSFFYLFFIIVIVIFSGVFLNCWLFPFTLFSFIISLESEHLDKLEVRVQFFGFNWHHKAVKNFGAA